MFFLNSLIKYFLIVITFITFFLLGFLLIGCASPSKAYSSVYLIQVSYNTSSAANATGGALRVNYMALCSTITDSMTCATLRNYTALAGSSVSSVSGQTLSLAQIASLLNDACTPYILVASLVLVFLLMVCELWVAIPLVPWKASMRRIIAGIALLSALIWGLGAMLQHQAIRCAQAFIESSTESAVLVKAGTRAESLSWTSFAFMVVLFVGSTFRVVRDMRETRFDEEKA